MAEKFVSRSLDAWQEHLQAHFTQLRDQRAALGGDHPLFALEHGLDADAVQDLSQAIRAYIVRDHPSRHHHLPWIVYCVELGYRYSGDEYWQTFESETPGWLANGSRHVIRNYFRLFHKRYHGAEPSGPWAQHFSIICWPITHAILPRDLQRQLARILYEIRHSFSAELLESPEVLGTFIAARSWSASSRFQNLAEEPRLIGQIAAALLLEGKESTGDLIHPVTLRRIGADLDRERTARDWLSDARRSARERVRVRGLGFGALGGRLPSEWRPEEARAEVAALGIEPRLILRPIELGGAVWEVLLGIPDLSHLLLRFPDARTTLAETRCVVAGAAGRPLARGRCLSGPQQVVLARWPRPDEVLLRFEKADPQLEYLLRTECLLRPRSLRLFRVAADGLAYGLRGTGARPGERYILVRTDGPIWDKAAVEPLILKCDGVYAAALELPEALDADTVEALHGLGVSQAKTIQVWPAGLAAVSWDGEGRGEWLASESPCLGILVDHPIEALKVSLAENSEGALTLTDVTPGRPIFLELSQLPVGVHTVRIGTRGPGSSMESIGELDVVMRVRAARPWSPVISPQGPLLVEMDPTTPSLEDLWEGRVRVSVQGPSDRGIACHASLLERGTSRTTASHALPPLAFPVTPDGWRSHFETHFRGLPAVQEAYDWAYACLLQFDAEELGTFAVRCERSFTALRWILRQGEDGYAVRLLDDRGKRAHPQVNYVGFDAPMSDSALEFKDEYIAPDGGGLYVARDGALTSAIIVPPASCGNDAGDIAPQSDERRHSLEAAMRVLDQLQSWSKARLPGSIEVLRLRRSVLRALAASEFRVLCGDQWARAEAQRGDGWLRALSSAISYRADDRALAARLESDHDQLASEPLEVRVRRIAEFGTPFLPRNGGTSHNDPPGVARVGDANDVQWLAEFALRLGSAPATVTSWAAEHLEVGLAHLLQTPVLARAARFLVLAVDHSLDSRTGSLEVYAGWDWP